MATEGTITSVGRSVADPHEMLAMQARWELKFPLRFPAPIATRQFIEVGRDFPRADVNHQCLLFISLAASEPSNWDYSYRTLQMINTGTGAAGMVAICQCPECGVIYWERIVCRNRSKLHQDGSVCILPRYHGGACRFVHHSKA